MGPPMRFWLRGVFKPFRAAERIWCPSRGYNLLKQWNLPFMVGKHICAFSKLKGFQSMPICVALPPCKKGLNKPWFGWCCNPGEQNLCVMFLFPQERNNSKLSIEMYIFFWKELPPVSSHHVYSIIWTLDFGVPPPSPLGISVAKPQTQPQVVSLSISIASCATTAIKARSERKRVAEKNSFFLAEYLEPKHRTCWGSGVKCWHYGYMIYIQTTYSRFLDDEYNMFCHVFDDTFFYIVYLTVSLSVYIYI